MGTRIGLSRLPLLLWRRSARIGWDRGLKLAAHISQVLLVVGGMAGYILTVRPINQKEKLEEDMVLLTEQASNRQSEARYLEFEIDRLRKTMDGLELDRRRLAKEQEEVVRKLEHQRARFDTERNILTAEHLRFREEKERERRDIVAKHSKMLESEMARARSAEQAAVVHAEQLKRVQTYERLRLWITKFCLSPQTGIFLDMRSGQINSCIDDAATRFDEWKTLPSDDQLRIRRWGVQANHTFQSVLVDNPAMYMAFGQLVMDEVFSSSSPCESAMSNSGEVIELKRPGLVSGTRCIGSNRMKETIADLVTHYSALQLAIEAAISGAADRRDPSTSFARPNAPTSLTVE
jgi:hypothetical protein